MINRDGYAVEISPIDKVDKWHDNSCVITRAEPGWGTFRVTESELNGFEPQAGDIVVVYTYGFSTIRGIVIGGRVIRYITPEQAQAEDEQWMKDLRLERLERYVSHGDELKRRVGALPAPLCERLRRFAAEGGVEFWVNDAEYELSAAEGAAALLGKVADLDFIHSGHANFGGMEGDDLEGAIDWINNWWALGYPEQTGLVPDFGDGHSGNTAASAYRLAVTILNGGEV